MTRAFFYYFFVFFYCARARVRHAAVFRIVFYYFFSPLFPSCISDRPGNIITTRVRYWDRRARPTKTSAAAKASALIKYTGGGGEGCRGVRGSLSARHVTAGGTHRVYTGYAVYRDHNDITVTAGR